jgi:hypothetical protein
LRVTSEPGFRDNRPDAFLAAHSAPETGPNHLF